MHDVHYSSTLLHFLVVLKHSRWDIFFLNQLPISKELSFLLLLLRVTHQRVVKHKIECSIKTVTPKFGIFRKNIHCRNVYNMLLVNVDVS